MIRSFVLLISFGYFFKYFDIKISHSFTARIWQYAGKGAWHFLSLPEGLSAEIRKNYGSEEEGWGRLKVSARIGSTEWQTALWFDSKANTYLLPIKSDVRKKEKIGINSDIQVVIII